MRTLAQLLDRLPLGEGDAAPPQRPDAGTALLEGLASGLPLGHLHLWGGPAGAGKCGFLLALLHAAARRGRGVCYATYDLPAETLASRLLALVADVPVEDLPDPGGPPESGGLDAEGKARARGARRHLAALPFVVEEARGYSVPSLEDRLVRLPFRPAVCAVDYVQAVVRPTGQDLVGGVRDLARLATRHHVAVVGAFRATTSAPAAERAAVEALARDVAPDRVGWLQPLDGGRREARVIANRHGALADAIALDD
ncbi:MAG: DnaB-like helicase C-terminal domain-containing protein [Planctomycetota bacterium]